MFNQAETFLVGKKKAQNNKEAPPNQQESWKEF